MKHPEQCAAPVAFFGLSACCAGPLSISADILLAGVPDPFVTYYGNTLFCQIRDSATQCRLWIDPDGRYKLFYDLGPQLAPADVNTGPWRFESQEGHYRIQSNIAGPQLCLTPNLQPVKLVIVSEHMLYADARCYDLAAHELGERWNQRDSMARQYSFWLLKGRYYATAYMFCNPILMLTRMSNWVPFRSRPKRRV
jgi:hypothetical protein